MWITPHPNGHLQAVGTDDAGRRQYLYHPQWRASRDAAKFDRILGFGKALSKARERVLADIGAEGMSQERGVRGRRTPARPRLLPDRQRRLHRHQRLLRPHHDAAGARHRGTGTGCGSASPASPGSSTDIDHRRRGRDRGARRDAAAGAAAATGCWRGRTAGTGAASSSGRRQRLHPRAAIGIEATAKDFRTWHATVIAASALAETDEPGRPRPRASARSPATMKEVSEFLGNTPDPRPHGVRRPAGRRGLRARPDDQGARGRTTPTTRGRRRSSGPCCGCSRTPDARASAGGQLSRDDVVDRRR